MKRAQEIRQDDERRRREPRLRPSQLLEVNVLGADQRAMYGSVFDISESGISLLLPVGIASGMPMKIETDEELLVGESCYCRPEGDGFRVGFLVKHRLSAALTGSYAGSSFARR